MVIIPEKKLIYIHIPRTGGMSLSLAFGKVFPNAIVDLDALHIHERRPSFRDYRTCTIMRSPYEIYQSHYRWCVTQQKNNFRGCTQHVKVYVRDKVRLGFQKAIRKIIFLEEITKSPGFIYTYCFPNTLVFDSHRRLKRYLGVNLPNIYLNESTVPPVAWDKDLLRLIRSQCISDFRFNEYPEPPIKKPRRRRTRKVSNPQNALVSPANSQH